MNFCMNSLSTKEKNPLNEFSNVENVKNAMSTFASFDRWYFYVDDDICVPTNINFNGDPNHLLKEYIYEFTENYVIVTRVK